MKKSNLQKRIEKQEEKLNALLRHLKLDVLVEYNEEDEWYDTAVVKRKHRWYKL